MKYLYCGVRNQAREDTYSFGSIRLIARFHKKNIRKEISAARLIDKRTFNGLSIKTASARADVLPLSVTVKYEVNEK